MQARIYRVIDKHNIKTTMVKATSQAQALRHVAKNRFAIDVPSALDVADYLTAAGTIEDATTEPEVAPGHQE